MQPDYGVSIQQGGELCQGEFSLQAAVCERRSLTTTDETKCDRKDALTIARLDKDPTSRQATATEACRLGYFELYMPRDIFAELKCLL